MNILMMTNTYTPLMGGLERSVKSFTEEYRRQGHRTVVVAPSFEGMPRQERDVIRVPAIQHFRGTDFSVRLPIPGLLTRALKTFVPDIVHAHHPFLMGDTALRLAAVHRLPLVFTHHTLFEQYTHYLPLNPAVAERFMLTLATGYANVCDHVFAPSQSVARLLRSRGVRRPIAVVPTGIRMAQFLRGQRSRFLADWQIDPEALIVGHVGRLASEKNLQFLCQAIGVFLRQRPRARWLVVGRGPFEPEMRRLLARAGVLRRVDFVGPLHGRALADAYRAMDVFAFSSHSETQGLVLVEAMAAGTPVVAVDAPGVREVVVHGFNGRLLPSDDVRRFTASLADIADLAWLGRWAIRRHARQTAERFSIERCAARALALYGAIAEQKRRAVRDQHTRAWERTALRLQAETKLLKRTAKATAAILAEVAANR